MIRIALVEDDPSCKEQTANYADRYAKENGVDVKLDCFGDGLEFLEKYSSDYTVVFMDIEMPYMNGLGVAKKLREKDEFVPLIFMTQMAQYAIKGYEVNAIDYVVKPVAYGTFSDKLKKAIKVSQKYVDYNFTVSKKDGKLLFIPNFYSLDGFLAVGGWLNLSFAVALVISSLFFFATVKLKIKDILFYSSAAYAVQNFSHNVSYIVNDLFGVEFRSGLWFPVSLAVFVIALVAVYFFIVKRIKIGEASAVDNLSIVVISVVTISITYILSMRFLPITSSDNIARFYAAGCCLFLLFMQFSIFDRGRAKIEKETIENLLYTQQKQYNVWKENVDIINVKCHDLKHRIYMARKTDDGEERSASLKEVEKAIMIYDNFAKTGNETLDIILTEKSLLCERKNIKFSYMIDGEKLSFISDEDLCSLFCNMLDNAIESASQVENEEKRIISLNASLCGNMLTVHQDNTHIGNVNMVDGIPKTTKSDERFHGFGIKSMQMIVDKYKGTMRFEVSEDKFCLDILFLI